MKLWISLWILLFGSLVWAQKTAYRAKVLNEEVHVFQKPDFDSPVIAKIAGGRVFDISRKPTKGFYRIRVKQGLLGYVPEDDVRPFFATSADSKKTEPKKNLPPKESENKETAKKKRSFQNTLFAGFQYAWIQYQENTMGGDRSEQLGFVGAKLSGPDLIIDGPIPTELNFLFHVGAPGYYEKLTGYGADGWVFLGNFLWQNVYPHGANAMTFFGFGPEFRYSKFRASLMDPSTGKPKTFLLDDMALGAVFDLGFSLRFKTLALRGDVQYHWEEQRYWGSSLSLQFGF